MTTSPLPLLRSGVLSDEPCFCKTSRGDEACGGGGGVLSDEPCFCKSSRGDEACGGGGGGGGGCKLSANRDGFRNTSTIGRVAVAIKLAAVLAGTVSSETPFTLTKMSPTVMAFLEAAAPPATSVLTRTRLIADTIPKFVDLCALVRQSGADADADAGGGCGGHRQGSNELTLGI